MKMKKEYLEFAKEIAFRAGEIMMKYYKGDNGADYKYDQTIVTLADREINDYLIERVKAVYPTHSVDGEEAGFGESNHVWVCDPVDGTAMYARHIPTSVFSLALMIDGISEVGVVYDVQGDQMYTAIRGEGAFVNGEPISVSDITLDDKRSLGNFDMWPAAEYNLFDVFKELGKRTYAVGLGSVIRASMCVAKGDFNFVLFPGTVHKNCDIAAAKVIVEEAGGRVTNLFGEDERYDREINGAVISNGTVHGELLSIVAKHVKPLTK
ncbi:MAG: inositol monophosphatase [Clostridia bacterium]|nr:inositol monophosphatase [Clostridia bacterium]